MRRRTFIAGLVTTLAQSTLVLAQQVQKMPVVGFLHPGFPDSGSPAYVALRDGLRESGYVDGDNVKIEARWGHGKPEILPQLTRELIQLRAAVLVATARAAIEA